MNDYYYITLSIISGHFATMQLDIMLSVEPQYLQAIQSLPTTVSEGDKLHNLTLPSPVTNQEHSEVVIKRE